MQPIDGLFPGPAEYPGASEYPSAIVGLHLGATSASPLALTQAPVTT